MFHYIIGNLIAIDCKQEKLAYTMRIETNREFPERLENQTQAKQESKEAGCWLNYTTKHHMNADTATGCSIWHPSPLGTKQNTMILANSNLCCQVNSCSGPKAWKAVLIPHFQGLEKEDIQTVEILYQEMTLVSPRIVCWRMFQIQEGASTPKQPKQIKCSVL